MLLVVLCLHIPPFNFAPNISTKQLEGPKAKCLFFEKSKAKCLSFELLRSCDDTSSTDNDFHPKNEVKRSWWQVASFGR
jgi:hypothetical protein